MLVLVLVLLAAVLLALLLASHNPLAIMALAGLAFILPLAVLQTATVAAPPVVAHGRVEDAKLCWATVTADIEVREGDRGYTTVVEVSIQPPNPCHHVDAVRTRWDPYRVAVIVEIEGRSPKPGTFCVQVLPPRMEHVESLVTPQPPKQLILKLSDSTTGKTCTRSIVLG
jgi:hypothetical protein